MSTILYRPHIDGLRAIAIIAVVLYHAHFLRMTGGFVGVDIFFVISGFLITSIIVRDIKLGTFSLLGFWERRVRRIIPALFVVMMISTVVASVITLYPPDYANFANAIIAQSVFSSNMFFMVTDNYFDQPSQYSPLLHTWTLSVEEQFYVLFPFVIMFCIWFASRYKKYRPIILEQNLAHVWAGERLTILSVLILGIISFGLNVWLVNVTPGTSFAIPFVPHALFGGATFASAGFYILPTRIWEFTFGVLLALYTPKIQSKAFAEILGITGLTAIAISIFCFNDTTPFPGIAALMPTLGAVAVILANERYASMSGRILSFPILVWIGLISYSLYLWHWPLLVFAHIILPHTALWTTLLVIITLAVVLSWFSYRYVETPFRRKTIFASQTMTFVGGFIAMVTVALTAYASHRFIVEKPKTLSIAAQKILTVLDSTTARAGMCFQSAGDTGHYAGLCRIGNNTRSKPDFVLLGDSHADADVPLFVSLGWTYGVQGSVFAAGDCIPILGVTQVPEVGGCTEQNTKAMEYIRDQHIKHIFLVARWSYYVTGGQTRSHRPLLTDAATSSQTPQESQKIFATHLTRMVSELTTEGRDVYIVKQVPEQFAYNPREAFYHALHRDIDIGVEGVTTKDNDMYQTLANEVIDSLVNVPHVHIINPASVFCVDGARCALENKDHLYYRDENHLSVAGTMIQEPLFESFFKQISNNKK